MQDLDDWFTLRDSKFKSLTDKKRCFTFGGASFFHRFASEGVTKDLSNENYEN